MARTMLQQPQMEEAAPRDDTVGVAKPSEDTPRWKISAVRLQREALIIWFILRNRKTPWYARIIAGCAAAYLLSPIQIIPSFIPVIGLMDDVVVFSMGMGLIRILAPKTLIHEAGRRASIAMGRGENILPAAVRRITLALAVGWLVLSLGVFLILWRKSALTAELR